jgi:hypothetical protein
MVFPDGVVRVITRLDFSDHHPLLITPKNVPHLMAPRQFRFESAWLMDHTYNEMLSSSWRQDQSVVNNLSNVQNNLKRWKFQSFDQVLRKKKEIMAHIEGIQRNIQTAASSRGRWRLEYNLQNQLRDILKKEELMWFQRSRAKWLTDGDRNTRYYHLKTINRRRRNNILMLRNSDGQWIEEVDQLQRMMNDFYQHLFLANHYSMEWSKTNITYPCLEENEIAALAAPITNKEVKNALFEMSPWKAPGPDGFPAGFYQKSWNIVGDTMCDFVRTVWDNPSKISEVNKTDICLIPKVSHPEVVTQFRPISLCNTNYKIVSKVMVERLKACIPLLISPYQTGFVPGRNIHENIVVAKEMIHSMHRMRGMKGAFAIKVDLSKAYDKLNWNFIWQVLKEINLPDSMVNVIMHAITSVWKRY